MPSSSRSFCAFVSGLRRARARRPPCRWRGDWACSARNLSLYDLRDGTGGKKEEEGGEEEEEEEEDDGDDDVDEEGVVLMPLVVAELSL